ncbi:MAG: hypothetical protein PHD51_03675 [Patescibacteria group bacterium]|nr:hypothetical protein [Patescibacteria group bacterium]MDD5490927.1 hypothetical protein [Patescibacteria group bacterium]
MEGTKQGPKYETLLTAIKEIWVENPKDLKASKDKTTELKKLCEEMIREKEIPEKRLVEIITELEGLLLSLAPPIWAGELQKLIMMLRINKAKRGF